MRLAAKEDHLVPQQGLAYVRHHPRIEIAAESDPVDPGADVLAQPRNGDLGLAGQFGQRRCG